MRNNKGMNRSLDNFLASQPPHDDQHWADLFGISRPHWNRIKNGKAEPSKAVIERMAERTDGAVPVVSWFSQEAH